MGPSDFHVATDKLTKDLREPFSGRPGFAFTFLHFDGAKKKARGVSTPRALQVLRLVNCRAKRCPVVLLLLPE